MKGWRNVGNPSHCPLDSSEVVFSRALDSFDRACPCRRGVRAVCKRDTLNRGHLLLIFVNPLGPERVILRRLHCREIRRLECRKRHDAISNSGRRNSLEADCRVSYLRLAIGIVQVDGTAYTVLLPSFAILWIDAVTLAHDESLVVQYHGKLGCRCAEVPVNAPDILPVLKRDGEMLRPMYDVIEQCRVRHLDGTGLARSWRGSLEVGTGPWSSLSHHT